MLKRLLLAALFAYLPVASGQDDGQLLTDREKMLLDRIERLEQRLSALEGKVTPPVAKVEPTVVPVPGVLSGTTLNANFDGYYGYNFNNPIGRVNLLRTNDITSDNFILGQADVILERAPDVSAGRRLGLRLDLMFGQNTEYLQGSAQNEPRPNVYRNIFQAYGTYVVPIGKGLTVDFGKFASSLGIENNYTKDQINYSRSYYFGFLPSYHMGFRSTYAFSDKVSAQYWLVNGANQTEGFSGRKANAFALTVTPNKDVSWNVNYFAGRERIFDTYASWNATKALQIAAEADYAANRSHVAGTAGYVKYQFFPKVFLGGRFEYLSDRGGLFSGQTQALKEATATLVYQPVEGFQMRWEYRRDYSNRPFFLSHTPGLLEKRQNTALLGLIWWFGSKQGAW